LLLAMVTLQKLEPSGVAHSCLCVGREEDTSCTRLFG
jgi:hypothetical protein